MSSISVGGYTLEDKGNGKLTITEDSTGETVEVDGSTVDFAKLAADLDAGNQSITNLQSLDALNIDSTSIQPQSFVGDDYGKVVFANDYSGADPGEKINAAIDDVRPDSTNNFFDTEKFGRALVIYLPPKESTSYSTAIDLRDISGIDVWGGFGSLEYTGSGEAVLLGQTEKVRIAAFMFHNTQNSAPLIDIDPASGAVSEVQFRMCHFRGGSAGSEGVRIRGAQSAAEHILFHDCVFNNCGTYGLHITGADTFLVTLDKCKVTNNGTAGVYLDVDTSGVFIHDTQFSDNGTADVLVNPQKEQFVHMVNPWFEGGTTYAYQDETNATGFNERAVRVVGSQQFSSDVQVNAEGLYRFESNTFDAVTVNVDEPLAEIGGLGTNVRDNSTIVNHNNVEYGDKQSQATGILESDQTIAQGTTETVQYTAASKDFRDELQVSGDTNPGRFVPKSAGTYKVSGHLSVKGTNLQAGDRVRVDVIVNGTNGWQAEYRMFGDGTTVPLPVQEFNVGENEPLWVEVEAYNTSGDVVLMGIDNGWTEVEFSRVR